MGQEKVTRAVLVHQGALGDLICTLPAISALRNESEKLVGVGSERLKLLEYCGVLDKAIASEALNFHQLFLEGFQPGPNLRSAFGEADLIVSWLGRKSARYRQNLERLSSKVSIFREAFPPGPGSEHITRILAKPVLELGIKINDFIPRLKLPAGGNGVERMQIRDEPFMAIHPGSGSSKKSVPLEKFFKILGLVSEIWRRKKLVIIGSDADKAMLLELTKRMPENLRPWVQIIENRDLAALAETLSRASLFLGTDSGPAHLAAALGVRTIVLFGPTDPRVWAPPQAWAKAITSNYACAPCPLEKRISCSEPKCMEAISEKLVADSIKDFLFTTREK